MGTDGVGEFCEAAMFACGLEWGLFGHWRCGVVHFAKFSGQEASAIVSLAEERVLGISRWHTGAIRDEVECHQVAPDSRRWARVGGTANRLEARRRG